MTHMIDARALRQRAEGQWERIYSALAPELDQAMSKWGRHVPCPIHGGKDGFRLHKDHRSGSGICNSCKEFHGKYMDGMGILMWLRGWPFPKMLEEVASIVAPEMLREGYRERSAPAARTPYRPPARRPEDLRDDLDKIQRMRKVWNAGIPITHPDAALAMRYFESRGLPLPRPEDGFDRVLRFVPRLAYFNKENDLAGYYPAIVARAETRMGMTVAIHRTYLAQDGSGKAPVEDPKKLMARPESVGIETAAIRLGALNGPVLATAEGIETALAVRAFTGFTCWATISASIMRMFVPVDGIKGVYIFGDLDRNEAGQSAMNDLRSKLEEKGYKVRTALPPGPIPEGKKGVDWLDVYNQLGKNALREIEGLKHLGTTSTVVPFRRSA